MYLGSICDAKPDQWDTAKANQDCFDRTENVGKGLTRPHCHRLAPPISWRAVFNGPTCRVSFNVGSFVNKRLCTSEIEITIHGTKLASSLGSSSHQNRDNLTLEAIRDMDSETLSRTRWLYDASRPLVCHRTGVP
jgi:hypothetical protein